MRPSHKATSLLALVPLALLLTACGKDYSPNTYASTAVQQASKVESGVVVGVRKVTISADPTVASATGAAAGGIAGSQVAEGAYSALGALGGAVVGGIAGSEAGHKMQDTYGYEYIVRNTKGDLLSVTQKDVTPLKIGQRVLLIQGSQARIVNDYTEHVDTDMAASPDKAKSQNAQKPDMSKAADKASEPLTTPAPNAQSTTDQFVGAAAAAAVTAVTAEGMKEKDKPAATTAAPATVATPAPAGTTIVPQPDTATTTTAPESAAPVATPAASVPSVKTSAPVSTPAPASPQPATQPKPAPSTTIVVPAPVQQTKSGTATTSPGTAPATGKGAAPAKDVAPAAEKKPDAVDDAAKDDAAKDKADADKAAADKASADKAATDKAATDKAAAQPSEPSADAPESDAPKTDAAPAKPDQGAAH